jgi:hypothetical protein
MSSGTPYLRVEVFMPVFHRVTPLFIICSRPGILATMALLAVVATFATR